MRVVIRRVPGVSFQGIGMMNLNSSYVAAPVVPTVQAAPASVYTLPASALVNINTASAPVITPPIPTIPTVSSDPNVGMDPYTQIPKGPTTKQIDNSEADVVPDPRLVPVAEEQMLADLVTDETAGGNFDPATGCPTCPSCPSSGMPGWSLWYLAAGGVGLIGGLAIANYFATKKA